MNTKLDTIDDLLDTEIAAILSAIGGLNNLSSAQVWDLANGIETGETPRQTIRLLRSVLVGLSEITSGTSEVGTVEFKRKDGTTVAVTVDYDTERAHEAVTVGTLATTYFPAGLSPSGHLPKGYFPMAQGGDEEPEFVYLTPGRAAETPIPDRLAPTITGGRLP